ncbi:hypothetical protein Poli38472_006499 [Pythium oligandrum]|uniref:DNA primase large subunit C-terminal domain-containing protein n=1 Tax=Pythium oligandrum TaxID=41045 RepID=A0A8K1FD44_PYTOL|nr:hypothetical protein Poli38472_006499 [Pythium oligandrum]|eukprot:TMW56489.1 hypothetical protein Poli38472_006499 [Pythium oligandrum]
MWWSCYVTPPTRAIALDELEEAARGRLLLLRTLAAYARAPRSKEELPTTAQNALSELDADPERDVTAHYALRLTVSRDPEHWEWFVRVESRLLRLRLGTMTPTQITEMLNSLGFQYQDLSRSDLRLLLTIQQLAWLDAVDQGSSRYFRVPFHEAARLVARRHVLLVNGFAWINENALKEIAVHHFKQILRAQLTALRRSLPAKKADMERLSPTLDKLLAESQSLHPARSILQPKNQLRVTPENIDQVAEKHFPLCMKHLHRKFRANHHLKYDGRVQYRMFLKGLGFSVHESMMFFRDEFTKVLPQVRFDREYAYHIRHSYGLEGSRKDYAPLDCQQIIQGSAPRHGQHHGCPFRHWDSATLTTELQRSGIPMNTVSSICLQAGRGDHQGACTRVFETLHHTPFVQLPHEREGLETRSNALHPNDWVRASLSLK